MERNYPNGKILRLLIGDITKIRVDAIVNAANSELQGGGGVDGAIHRVGGPSLMRELDRIRKETGTCPTGSAVITSAGALPAQFVIHAVGPIYRDGSKGEPQQLAAAYRISLELAEERGARTISFPAISAGAYGYPVTEAAAVSIEAVESHLKLPAAGIREALFVLYDKPMYDVYARVLGNLPAS